MSDRPKRPPLDPDAETMRRWGYAAIDAIVEHLAELSDKPVSNLAPVDELTAELDEPLPREGCDPQAAMQFFQERIAPRMTLVNHPRFHGYLPAPGSFFSTLGEVLASGTNPFVGSWLGSGGLGALELVVLRWIAQAVGYPTDACGCLSSGGSMANLTALAAARAKHDIETLRDGVIYHSTQAHHSVEKAARVLGYRQEQIVAIAVDEQFRMDMQALRERVARDRSKGLRPFAVVANAGTTNTGSIDPLDAIVSFCEAEGLWSHIDGAYGGFAALSPRIRPKLAPLERADSLTLDPHKWLYAGMGVGCVFVREERWLEQAFSSEGGYLRDIAREQLNFFDRGPELSRPGRVLSAWMVLKCAGLDELRRQVEWDLDLAAMAADLIAEDPRLELVCRPELSVFAFRHRAADGEDEAQRGQRDHELVQRALADGGLLVSSTHLHERNAVRFVVMNHRSDEDEVRRSIARLRELVVDAPG